MNLERTQDEYCRFEHRKFDDVPSYTAIVVAVAVRGHTHGARPCIPLFYHDLVTYTATRWKMIN